MRESLISILSEKNRDSHFSENREALSECILLLFFGLVYNQHWHRYPGLWGGFDKHRKWMCNMWHAWVKTVFGRARSSTMPRNNGSSLYVNLLTCRCASGHNENILNLATFIERCWRVSDNEALFQCQEAARLKSKTHFPWCKACCFPLVSLRKSHYPLQIVLWNYSRKCLVSKETCV